MFSGKQSGSNGIIDCHAKTVVKNERYQLGFNPTRDRIINVLRDDGAGYPRLVADGEDIRQSAMLHSC